MRLSEHFGFGQFFLPVNSFFYLYAHRLFVYTVPV